MDESATGRGKAAPGRPTPASVPVGLLAFVYGLADTDELPGPALVRLMGDCGMGESAVRSLLARLRTSGDLVATRRGRRTEYTLAGALRASWERGRSGAHDVDGDGVGARPTAWNGSLYGILYSAPERHRSFRDHLRRLAWLAGYAPFAAGLVVGVDDRWDLVAAQLQAVPAGGRVAPLTLSMRREDAADALARAWGLDDLARRYLDLARDLDAAVTESVRPDAATLRRFEQLTHPVYSAFVRDPGLPTELMPAGWPLPRLREALARVTAHYEPAVVAYLDEVLARGPDPAADDGPPPSDGRPRRGRPSRVDSAHERDHM